ncbi:hypothetical protein, partial [Clostridioides difficile]|uniref:hypothetical protein n=1 Tax=Clostridioides difficile TaxID=1496 RepID=UPI00163DE0BB
LARGEIQVIGATTIDEYRKHVEKDSALERRFQPVMVDEPTKEYKVLFFSVSGTFPKAIFVARPSAMAVFPTPGSPINTGLF